VCPAPRCSIKKNDVGWSRQRFLKKETTGRPRKGGGGVGVGEGGGRGGGGGGEGGGGGGVGGGGGGGGVEQGLAS